MWMVIGLFESKGIAEDAVNRLTTLGVPTTDRSIVVMRQTGPVPATMQTELEARSFDPLVWGNVRDSFVTFLRE